MPKPQKPEDCAASQSLLDLGVDYVSLALEQAFPVRSVPRGLLVSHGCEECLQLHDSLSGRRWTDVAVRVIGFHADSLPLLTTTAHQYYLPRYLTAALSRQLPPDHILLDMVIYNLCPDAFSRWQGRFGIFTPPQLQAVAHWLEFVLSHESDFWPDTRAASVGYETYWKPHQSSSV